ncbi:sigma-70 family RNA polymerase sigma factor [bacterium]|nr:MAG: sigma-70 family RNA polymerase sigma factor [bacterium]
MFRVRGFPNEILKSREAHEFCERLLRAFMANTDSNLLAQPVVRNLISQGARDGRVSFAQINDLLVDLELDEEDVELLYEALEKRAIAIVDEEFVPSSAPQAPKTKTTPKAKKPGPHDDLDAILADLDMIKGTEDDVDSVAQFLAENDEETYVGDDLDDSQRPVDDALKVYLTRMGQIPRLDAEEERELALEARSNDPEVALDAKNRLVESNLRLVVHLAKSAATRTTLSITDLLQEGNIGLLDAVERYRADSNKTFGAYATWWVRRAMNRAIQEHSRVLRLSGELYAAIQTMQIAQRELTQKLGRMPSRQEIATATGLTIEQIEEAQRAAVKPLSLENPVGGDEGTTEFGETLEGEDEAIELRSERMAMAKGLTALLEDLPDRDKAVLSMRFGLGDYEASGPQAVDDVAALMNLSRERVHDIEVRALRKLRKKARSSGLSGSDSELDD